MNVSIFGDPIFEDVWLAGISTEQLSKRTRPPHLEDFNAPQFCDEMLMKIDEYLDEIYQNREEDPQLSMSSCWYNTAHLLKGATLLLAEQAKSVYEDAHTLLVQSTTTRLWFDVKQKGKKSKSKANHEVQVTAQLRVESYEIEIGTTAMDSQKFMELLNANNNANSVLERLITLPSPPPLFENREENMLDMVDNQFSELSGEEYQSVVDVIRNNQNEDFGFGEWEAPAAISTPRRGRPLSVSHGRRPSTAFSYITEPVQNWLSNVDSTAMENFDWDADEPVPGVLPAVTSPIEPTDHVQPIDPVQPAIPIEPLNDITNLSPVGTPKPPRRKRRKLKQKLIVDEILRIPTDEWAECVKQVYIGCAAPNIYGPNAPLEYYGDAIRWFRTFEPFPLEDAEATLVRRMRERHPLNALFKTPLNNLRPRTQPVFQVALKTQQTEVDETILEAIEGCGKPDHDRAQHHSEQESQFDFLKQDSVAPSRSLRRRKIPSAAPSIRSEAQVEAVFAAEFSDHDDVQAEVALSRISSPDYSPYPSHSPVPQSFYSSHGRNSYTVVSSPTFDVTSLYDFLENFEHRLVSNGDDNDYNDDELIRFCGSETMNPLLTMFDEIPTLKKLIYCWRRNREPIAMAHLNFNATNRLNAAKTFTSLLVLRKKGLIEIQSNEQGEVMHIGQGDKLNNIDIAAGGCNTESTDES